MTPDLIMINMPNSISAAANVSVTAVIAAIYGVIPV